MLEISVSVLPLVHFFITQSTEMPNFSSSHSMSKFEVIGGLVSGTEESRGKITLDRPNRQWDFP